MSKLSLGMKLDIFCFLLLIMFSAISSYMLIYIKKTQHRKLWEQDKQQAKWWKTPEKLAMREIAWKTPQWVMGNGE